MLIYIVSFLLNMLVAFLLHFKRDGYFSMDELDQNKRKKKIYLILTALQLGLLCGLRSEVMAYDTWAYRQIFDMCPDTWGTILHNETYVEFGFGFLCSLIKILGGNFQVLLLISGLFVMASCCIFIYRHSNNVMLSVFIIISFPFFYSAFDIIRHFMATAFLLLGYKYVEERKPIKYLIFILLGSLFHIVSLLFLPLYFIKKIKWNWITALGAAITTALLYVLIEPVAILIGNLLGKSNGIASGWIGSFGGGIRTALMYAAIMVIAAWAYYRLRNRTRDDMTVMIWVLLMLMFSILFINARMMTRMIMTMVPFVAIAIPRLLDHKRMKSAMDYWILTGGFLVIGVIYHAFLLLTNWQHVVPYVPFWS